MEAERVGVRAGVRAGVRVGVRVGGAVTQTCTCGYAVPRQDPGTTV